MISYFMFGTNNFPAARRFYDRLMGEMGASKAYEIDNQAGWGWGIGTPLFILCKPHDGQPATHGNGTMLAFDTESPEQVDRLHALVLELGGSDEGAPGPRGENLYAAYCRDPDGNKFNFIHSRPPAG